MAENYDCDIDGTQNGKLVGLLEKTAFSLEESPGWILAFGEARRWRSRSHIHRAVAIILDGSDLDFSSAHDCQVRYCLGACNTERAQKVTSCPG